MGQNWNFCLYFENSRRGPILRLQMRAKEEFNRHQVISVSKWEGFFGTPCIHHVAFSN